MGSVCEKKAKETQRKDPAISIFVTKEAPVLRLRQQPSGNTIRADRPRAANLAAQVLDVLNGEACCRSQRAVVALTSHAGEPTLTADRLQQVSYLPSLWVLACKPGVDAKTPPGRNVRKASLKKCALFSMCSELSMAYTRSKVASG